MALPFLEPALMEWHKLPKGGKIAVAVAFVAVAGFGYYEYRKNAGQSSGTQSSTGLANSSNGQTATGFGGVDLSSLATSIAGLINAGNTGQGGTTSTGTTSTTPTSPTGTVNPGPGTTGQKHGPGDVFTASSGVTHYVVTGNETLGDIAKKLGLSGGWNAIYGIPDNQKLLGKKNATTLKTFKPTTGTVITVPTGSKAKTGGGGPIHSEIPYRTMQFDNHIVQRYQEQPNGHLYPQSYSTPAR